MEPRNIPNRPKAKRVAACLDYLDIRGHKIVHGLNDFAKSDHRQWTVLRLQRPDCYNVNLLQNLQIDGVVGALHWPKEHKALKALGIPVVAINSSLEQKGIYAVHSDGYAAGQVIARHLMQKEYRHFAYLGYSKVDSQVSELSGFQYAISASGQAAHKFMLPSQLIDDEACYLPEREKELTSWLASLPKPVGIMTTEDRLGAYLINLCSQADINVPLEVGVVGVGDDVESHPLTDIQLSILPTPSRMIGHHAGRILSMLFDGDHPEQRVVRCKPLELIEKNSSNYLLVNDDCIARALEYIRSHICEPISVDDICRSAGISRRSLERRFKDTLGRTPSGEIKRIRYGRACQLLSTTDLKLNEIAEQIGLSGGRHLGLFFKSMSGMTTSQYRSSRGT